MTGADLSAWPMDALRLRHRGLVLRPVTESDLSDLVILQPDDYEHDPRIPQFSFHTRKQHRARLVHQGYWRSRGSWTPQGWALDLVVLSEGEVIGVQSLEAEDFPELRTVDSGSWLVPAARGRGIGTAMREAVLGLAFDHLDAVAAVSSARIDNQASLGVSRRCGYRDNGVTLTRSESGPVELQHLRLTAEDWRGSPSYGRVEIVGLTGCREWFGVAT